MDISILICILAIHYVFDWVFQSRNMAEKKSNSLKWLGIHCFVYTLGLSSLMVLLPDYFSWVWVLANGCLHFLVDFVSSKMTSYHYKKNQMSKFWRTIGFDQYLHYLCLFLTYNFLIIE